LTNRFFSLSAKSTFLFYDYRLKIHILNKSGNHHFSDRVQLPAAKVEFDDLHPLLHCHEPHKYFLLLAGLAK
jgi:hypothetical protein